MTKNIFDIFLLLGSNLGNKKAHLKEALVSLEDEIEIEKLSSVYETEPIGASKHNYYNMVVKGKTFYTPHKLLEQIHFIEAALGRKRSKKTVWGDRVIDIDILIYQSLMMNDYQLTIPHKELIKRIFVLEPLSELTSEYILFDKTIKEHLNFLKELQPKYFIKKIGFINDL